MSISPAAAVLRDAILRIAPQDEGVNGFHPEERPNGRVTQDRRQTQEAPDGR